MPRFTPHFALKIVFLSPRTFSQALTLGAILAATDPVAVVSALHELGAPGKLSVLIDGESLLNDGTAMVFFLIFTKVIYPLNFSIMESIDILPTFDQCDVITE